jgi:hypothetical protein
MLIVWRSDNNKNKQQQYLTPFYHKKNTINEQNSNRKEKIREQLQITRGATARVPLALLSMHVDIAVFNQVSGHKRTLW